MGPTTLFGAITRAAIEEAIARSRARGGVGTVRFPPARFRKGGTVFRHDSDDWNNRFPAGIFYGHHWLPGEGEFRQGG